MLRKLSLALVSVSLIVMCTPLVAIAQSYTFDANRLMDDTVFNNSNSMTADQINSFLNTFPNSCISTNSGFASSDPVGYSPTSGYIFGNHVSAGNVIYDAAQAYQLNPQVIITQLELQQGLVTGQGGCAGDMRYAAAMGYACPDSGGVHSYSGLDLYQRNGVTVTSVTNTCVMSANRAGFSQQIIYAAWLLKFAEQRSEGSIGWAIIQGSWNNSDDLSSCYYGPFTQGTRQVCPSGISTYYDGNFTLFGGTVVHLTNGATASLYNYIPHMTANQYFFNTFTNWFGSPFAQPPSVSMTINGASSATVSYGSNVTLAWNGQNVDNCTVSPGNLTGLSGSNVLVAVADSTTYTVNCTGTNGIATGGAALTVLPPTTSYLQNILKTDIVALGGNTSIVNGLNNQLSQAEQAYANGNITQAQKLVIITINHVDQLQQQGKISLSDASFYDKAAQTLLASW